MYVEQEPARGVALELEPWGSYPAASAHMLGSIQVLAVEYHQKLLRKMMCQRGTACEKVPGIKACGTMVCPSAHLCTAALRARTASSLALSSFSAATCHLHGDMYIARQSS